MQNNKGNILYNTKISKEAFESIERQRSNSQENKMKLIESRFSGGTLSGLQSKLRTTVSVEEKLNIKSTYRDKEGLKTNSTLDTNFKSRGIGRTTDIGYTKDNL